MFWKELEQEGYWDALAHLKKILLRRQEDPEHARENPNDLSDEKLAEITCLMIAQVLAGRKVASVVPLYSDVWGKI